jgi:Helix-turn-helix domain of resolvase
LGAGGRFGRPPKLTAEQVVVARRLIEEGTAVRETARILNVHVATLYRALATAAPGDMTGRLRRAADDPVGHRYLGQERFPDALSTMEVEYPSAWKKASLQPSGDGGGC